MYISLPNGCSWKLEMDYMHGILLVMRVFGGEHYWRLRNTIITDMMRVLSELPAEPTFYYGSQIDHNE